MTIFAISDIHSFYTETQEALHSHGYDVNNSDHLLIICGDLFDRGDETIKVWNWINTLPVDRTYFVLGNHEDLMIDMVDRGYFLNHDIHNRTIDTYKAFTSSLCIEDSRNTIQPLIDFIKNRMVDSVETSNYIFIHSTIPQDDTPEQWRKARWSNPFLASVPSNINKTVVFGHWHTAWMRDYENNDYRNRSINEELIENFGIWRGSNKIGLDGCTVFTHKVNVLVLENEEIVKIKKITY